MLHRILKVRPNDYVICGDNRYCKEYGITDRHIIVVLTVLLVLAQIGMRAVLRWLNELSRATFENIFKLGLCTISCEKTSQA